MIKTKISSYFNPDQHLVFHQDKEGNMLGGGYQINNLLFNKKVPLFVSIDDATTSSAQVGGGSNEHFIPEKFSDLFRDLAIPAGLFMMPALHRPRNYAFEVPELDTQEIKNSDNYAAHDAKTDTNDTESSSDNEEEYNKTKQVPKDIFDALLALVSPAERIQHDVKTRRQRQKYGVKDKKRQNKTKRSRV
jgi:hypothetical protein